MQDTGDTTSTGNRGPIPGVFFPHRVVSVSRRADLRAEVERARKNGELAEIIYGAYTRIFDCPFARKNQDARSIIVGAVAHPQSRVVFTWEGARVPLLVPPSYIRYWDITRKAEEDLNKVLEPLGYWAHFASLPQKALAVASGLALYGRNNITFVPGLGSFHMLVSYYSNMPLEDPDNWLAPSLLERCSTCTACRKACPTGAITPDRVVIRQERCMTFYSGYSGLQDLPDWLDPSWIECLVGCRRCQIVCPENLPFRNWIEDEEEFSQDETEQLVRGLTPQTLTPGIRGKLEKMGLIEFFGLPQCLEMLSRKLTILLRNR